MLTLGLVTVSGSPAYWTGGRPHSNGQRAATVASRGYHMSGRPAVPYLLRSDPLGRVIGGLRRGQLPCHFPTVEADLAEQAVAGEV